MERLFQYYWALHLRNRVKEVTRVGNTEVPSRTVLVFTVTVDDK